MTQHCKQTLIKSHEIATAYAQKEQELEEKYIEWDKLTEELANKA